jgi:hypothetical protein
MQAAIQGREGPDVRIQEHEFKFMTSLCSSRSAEAAPDGDRAAPTRSRASSRALGTVYTTALLAGLEALQRRTAAASSRCLTCLEYVADEVPKSVADDQHPIFKADNSRRTSGRT